jgi:hypothetical protein
MINSFKDAAQVFHAAYTGLNTREYIPPTPELLAQMPTLELALERYHVEDGIRCLAEQVLDKFKRGFYTNPQLLAENTMHICDFTDEQLEQCYRVCRDVNKFVN